MRQYKFQLIEEKDLEFFRETFGRHNVIHDKERLIEYGSDETEDLSFPPEVVVIPESSLQISSFMAYCNKRNIPVTPRGAGTGLSGGAIPIFGGVSLSMEKMNAIVEIDERNFQVTVEPGVITQVLQEAVEEKGLYYPPDPASRGSCFIGGNIAENSGGPKAVKYGVTKDYILNLEVVLPSGEIIWTGANVLKNSTGYNLTQLMVGSEGTLGIVTKAVIRRNSGGGETFTVRKISSGVGVERIFPLHSPFIDSIKIVRKGSVRRSRIFYQRERTGKAARIKEKRTS